MSTQEFNREKSEAFAGRMVGALNEAAVAEGRIVGHAMYIPSGTEAEIRWSGSGSLGGDMKEHFA